VVLWNDAAENFAEEVVKGCLINIEQGILKHPVKDYKGEKRYYTEVVILDYTLEENFNEKKKSKSTQKNYKGGKKKKMSRPSYITRRGVYLDLDKSPYVYRSSYGDF
jgi:single-stranded DNA-binding protein